MVTCDRALTCHLVASGFVSLFVAGLTVTVIQGDASVFRSYFRRTDTITLSSQSHLDTHTTTEL